MNNIIWKTNLILLSVLLVFSSCDDKKLKKPFDAVYEGSYGDYEIRYYFFEDGTGYTVYGNSDGRFYLNFNYQIGSLERVFITYEDGKVEKLWGNRDKILPKTHFDVYEGQDTDPIFEIRIYSEMEPTDIRANIQHGHNTASTNRSSNSGSNYSGESSEEYNSNTYPNTNYNNYNSSGNSTNEYSNVGSNNSSNTMRTCPMCNGSGQGPDQIVYSPNYTGENNDEYCGTCGKTMSAHYHKQSKCATCNGRGQVAGY